MKESSKELVQHSFASSFRFYVRSACKEIKKRCCFWFLAVLSVLIVVAATAVARTVIDNAPIIFLRQAEVSSGAYDVQITSRNLGTGPLYINHTQVRSRMETSNYRNRSTPRIAFSAGLAPLQSSEELCPANPASNDTADLQQAVECLNARTTLYFVDTQNEERLGLGPKIIPGPLGPQLTQISGPLARSLNISPGDIVFVFFSADDLINALIRCYNLDPANAGYIITPGSYYTNQIVIPVLVNSSYEDLNGKLPQEDIAQSMVMEFSTLFQLIAKYYPRADAASRFNGKADRFFQYISTINPEEFSPQIIFMLENREKVYLDNNYDNIQAKTVAFGSEISEHLGFFPFTMDLPVTSSLSPLQYAGLFFGLVLNLVIVVLFLLSCILIYNLLMVTVETKTYEYGVMRLIGMSKRGIVEIILIQSFTFSLPGVIVGLLLSFPILKGLSTILENFLQAKISAVPTASAFILSIFIGVLIPFVSSMVPIITALQKNLGGALDLVRSKVNSVLIRITLTANEIPWTKISFSVVAILYGASVYYLLPLSLLTLNIGLLLTIFFAIIVGLLIGLVLFGLNVQHLMERLTTWTFFFYMSPSFREILVKNLVAHKLKNRKTASMYALTLGFVIFLIVAASTGLQSFAYINEQEYGATMQIRASGYFDVLGTDDFLQSNAYLREHIRGYTYVTDNLRDFLRNKGVASDSYITNVGKLYNFKFNVHGVTPGYLNYTFADKFYKPYTLRKDTGLELIEQLYTVRGSQSGVIGEYPRSQLNLNMSKESRFLVHNYAGVNSEIRQLRVGATLGSAPFMYFSNFPGSKTQGVMVSVPTYMDLGRKGIKTYQDVPFKWIMVDVKNSSSAANVSAIIRSYSDTKGYGWNIWSYYEFNEKLSQNTSAINIIFIVMQVVAMLFCYFSLITTMTANIYEQTKEIAILRAVGLTKRRIIFIYISEAFVLVFASSFAGVAIGTIIGYTMVKQNTLFLGIPIPFVFPWQNLIAVFIVAILSSFASTAGPIRRIVKKQIADIARGG